MIECVLDDFHALCRLESVELRQDFSIPRDLEERTLLYPSCPSPTSHGNLFIDRLVARYALAEIRWKIADYSLKALHSALEGE